MAGIAFLRRLLLKQAMKESAGSSGIMSLNKGLVDDVDNTVKKWIDSAKRQGQDIDKMGEQEIKYIVELNKKPRMSVISQDDARFKELTEKLGLNDPKKNKFLQKESEVIEVDFDKNKNWFKGKSEGVIDVVSDTVTKIKTMEPVAAMKEANLVIGRKGKYKNLTKEQSQKILKETDDWIFQRDPDDLYDYNKKRPFRDDPDYDPEDFAQGGRASTGLNYLLGEDDQNTRVPYSKGSGKKESWTNKLTRWGGGPSMVAGELGFEGLHQIYQLLGMGGLYAEGGRTGFGIGGLSRRAFLKLMGAGAAGVGAAKSGLFGLLKAGKPAAVETLTSVPIGNAAGMPAWFKPLVNKVIKEGEDVTKQFSTKEREIVHQVSLEGKIGSPDALGVDDIRVTQSLDDGTIRVQYNTVDSPGEYGVDLIYKKGEEIPTKKGSVKTKDEFTAVEAEPRYSGGPEDADLEWDGENLVDNVDDLLTDTTKLEAYATGKKPNIKKLLKSEQKQKKTKQLNESNAEQANYIEEKYGPGPDPSDYYHDYASGGRVPLAEGTTPSDTQLEQYYKNLEEEKKRKRRQREFYEQRFGGPGPILEAASGGVAGLLGE